MGDLRFIVDSIMWDSLSKKHQKNGYESLSDGGIVFKNFSERLKYENRHWPGALWDEILTSDKPEVYKEELRRQNQLELESTLLRETAKRLGVYDSCPSLNTTAADYYYDEDYDIDECYEYEGEHDYVTTSVTPKNKLQLSRNKLRLYNMSIHPCIVKGRRGKTVSGTLEAHTNGFRYKNYSIPFELDILFHNVGYAFFQDGDKEMAPLCHLHLHNPITVGTEVTKDIQFRMVQTSKGRSMRRLVGYSDEFKKECQKRKGDSELIRNFLSEVGPICLHSSLLQFAGVDKKHGFYGEMTLKEHLMLPAIFVFTFTCLVQLKHKPFTVVILREIEIVHLVPAGSEMEMLNMTIVFKDFKRDVLQISSIPLTQLISIKGSLNIGDVKYYESQYSKNKLDIPLWRCILKKVTDNPKTFIEEGGWNFLKKGDFINLGKLFHQDSSLMTYCSDIEPGQASDSKKKTMSLSVTTRTMPVGKRVMASSSESEYECVSGPKVNEKEMKHTAETKLVKIARRQMVMVMSDESD